MDRISASLERIKALWRQLEHAKQGSPEYEALAKQIRAESDAYNALLEAKKSPPKTRGLNTYALSLTHPNRGDYPIETKHIDVEVETARTAR